MLLKIFSGLLALGLIAAAGCSDDSPGTNDNNQNNTNPVCGNGQQEGTEECDGTDLGSETCESQGLPGGTLACYGNCTFDTTACDPELDCGNGQIDDDEECDGGDFGSASCVTETGISSGNLVCTAHCAIDTSSCYACGDASIDGQELCDGSVLDGETCMTQAALSEGELACGGSCLFFDTSDCHECGNSAAEGPEQCDNQDLNGGSCTALGYPGPGVPGCLADCTFDTSPCCGDGNVGGSEECDDANGRQYDGCHDCSIDDIHIQGVATGYCGSPQITEGFGGELIAVYPEYNTPNAGVYIRRFGASSLPFDAPQLVESPSSFGDVDVAADATGAVVVVWDEGNWGDTIHAKLLDSAGAALGPSFVVNEPTNGTAYDPRVARAPSGGFAIVWEGEDALGDAVFARIFDSSGSNLTSAFMVNPNTFNELSYGDVAVGSDDSFVIVWYQQFGPLSLPTYSRIMARAYGSNGMELTSAVQVSPTGTNGVWQTSPSVTPVPGGGYMIAWTKRVNWNDSIEMRRLDAAYAPTGSALVLVPTDPEDQVFTGVGVSSSGAYVVTWCRACAGSGGDADGDEGGIFMRRFDAQDNPLGPVELVNIYTQNMQSHPALAMQPGGQFAISWIHYNLNGVPAAMMQRFSSSGQALGSLPW